MVEKKDLEKKIQEKYLQIEMLNKELEKLSFQLELINSKLNESIVLKKSLDKIQKVQSFSQLGSGIFVLSEIKDNNTFLVNVGRRIFVKMKKSETEKYLEKKIDDLNIVISQILERRKELQKEVQKNILSLQKLQPQ